MSLFTTLENEVKQYFQLFWDVSSSRSLESIKSHTFKVSVPLSAVGETRGEVLVSYPSEDIQKKLKRLEKRDIFKKDLIEVGKQLTARLFPSEQIRNLFQRTFEEAGSEGSVRMRFYAFLINPADSFTQL